MKINITYTGANPQRVHYVLGYIQGHPYVPDYVLLSYNDWADADVNIDYTHTDSKFADDSIYFMPAQELVFGTSKKSYDWVANKYTFAKRDLYSVESGSKDQNLFIEKKKFRFDIIEAIFFHLARYEEYYAPKEQIDQWNMMHEKHHFLVRQDLHHIPVVDHLVEAFLLSIGVEPELFQSKLTITHDIDVLRKFPDTYKFVRAMGGDLLRNRSLSSLSNMYKLYTQVRAGDTNDPYDTFDRLFDQGNHRKIVYIMAGGTSPNDEKYDIDNDMFRSISDLAIERGYQIGLHPSYNSYDNYIMITQEREKLQNATGQKIRTSRQHFLRFSFDETITALSDSGIYEDSSLGYQRKIGFRCGTAFTYLLYDLRRDRVSRVSETPMIIMDGALLEECSGDPVKAHKMLSNFADRHRENSHLTINFHNVIFDPTRYDSELMWKMYHMIIKKFS